MPRLKGKNDTATNVGYEAERDNYLHPALQAGFIEMTVPDKPNSRLQKYRLTEKGRQLLRNPDKR